MTDTFVNEAGEEGHADAMFCVENGQYTAILIAEKRWRTPSGKPRAKKVVASFKGETARELAAALRENGWEPPKGLARLCESAPRSKVKRWP